jgi:hypothetical protein
MPGRKRPTFGNLFLGKYFAYLVISSAQLDAALRITHQQVVLLRSIV